MRFLRSGWFLLTLVVLLALGWYTWGLDWLAERQWQAYVAEARARGVKFALAELRPPRVQESDDLLQTVAFRDPSKGKPYTKLLQRGPIVRRLDSTDGRLMPPDWAETRSAMRGVAVVDPAEPDHIRAVQCWLVEFQPLLEALIEVRTRSGNWDDLWTTYGAGPESSLHLVFGGMRLLTFKAEADLASGDVSAARTFLDAHMRLAKCFESAPRLDAEVFRQYADAEFRSALYSGMEMRTWRDEDLRAFLEFYTKQNVLERYRWALETGRAHWAELCEKRVGNRVAKARWNDLRNWQLRVRSARKRWWRINGEWLQRFFDEEIGGFDAARGTWSIPHPRKFDVGKIDPNDVDFGLVNTTRMFMEEILAGAVFTHAMNKMAGIACALELHRRQRGEYPEQLEELIPEFFTILPNDPCGGKPLRYRRDESEGYLLYSIGANERDDGGGIGGQWNYPDWRWWAPRAK